MFIFALIGIAVNLFAALKVSRGKTMNEKMVSWHLLEDVFGWVAVLLVSILMHLTDISRLDPILSLLFSIYILINVYNNFKKIFFLFLQSTPENFQVDKIEHKLKEKIGEAKDFHHTHIWSLDGETHILSTHLVISRNTAIEKIISIKCCAKEVCSHLGIDHATIEIEFEGERCEILCQK